MGQGAFSLTVNSTAGGLTTAITAAGGNLSTVTDLTVTGTIDARDFKTMYNDMTVLSVLDLSAASIVEYNGYEGIVPGYSWNFQNEMPSFNVSFKGKQSLTSIICPVSLTAFGGFQDCKSLISVTLPSGITRIPDSAFSGCIGLNSINIPSKVTEIAAHAFSGCIGLTSITIPSSVSTIIDNSFFNCSAFISVDPNNAGFSSHEGVFYNKLQTILKECPISKTGSYILPATVTTINYQAFYHCIGLSSVTLPSSVNFIGGSAFEGCLGLNSVILPNGLTSLSSMTFSNCTGLTSIILPNTLKSIGLSAFNGCTGLTNINIPNAVTSISDQVFYGCTGLTSIIIPNGVTAIGNATFFGCSGLTSVTIGSGVTTIADQAFDNCVNLKTIYSLNTTPPTLGSGCFTNIAVFDPTKLIQPILSAITDVYVPTDDAVTGYKGNFYWISWFPGAIIKKGAPSSITNLPNNQLKVYATQSAIIIDGTSAGETVVIYNINGIMLQTIQSQGERLTIPVEHNSIYLVKTSNKTVKVKM